MADLFTSSAVYRLASAGGSAACPHAALPASTAPVPGDDPPPQAAAPAAPPGGGGPTPLAAAPLPPPPAAAPPPTAGASGPRLRVGRARASGFGVRVAVACGEPCRLVATGHVAFAGRAPRAAGRVRVRTVRRSLAASERNVLRLAPRGRDARIVRRVLGSGRGARARVELRAVDADGRASRSRATARLRPGGRRGG